MKNAKRIFVLLLAFSMFFVLCGCDALDEMRDLHAFVQDEHTIIWQGNVYKELPYDEFLRPETSLDQVVVTQPDVPVLLDYMFCEKILYPSEDKQFLESSYGEIRYYCIETIYDELCDRIWRPFSPEMVCYDYSWYNEETGEYETDTYTLTQEQIDALALIVEQEQPTELSDGMYLSTRNTIYLEECTADRIFRRDTMKLSVSANGKTYYLTVYTDYEEILFTVPAGCNAMMEEIYAAYNSVHGISYEEVLPGFDL